MSFAELRKSLGGSQPPAGLSPAVEALWFDARGEWDQAHTRAQADAGRDANWVHAYLHRKEGDIGNADYWYARAGRTRPGAGVTLENEWEQIARALLGEQT